MLGVDGSHCPQDVASNSGGFPARASAPARATLLERIGCRTTLSNIGMSSVKSVSMTTSSICSTSVLEIDAPSVPEDDPDPSKETVGKCDGQRLPSDASRTSSLTLPAYARVSDCAPLLAPSYRLHLCGSDSSLSLILPDHRFHHFHRRGALFLQEGRREKSSSVSSSAAAAVPHCQG